MLLCLRHQDRLPWKEIGARINRTVESCCARYRALIPAHQRMRFAGQRKPQAEITVSKNPRRFHFDVQLKREAPPERLADRDRRMAAVRDITSEFFGDPRPGQSALDKKQAAYA